MAGIEISALPPLAGTALQSLDVLPIVDLSAAETKKVTALDLVLGGINAAGTGTVNPNIIDWGSLAPELIDGSSIVIESIQTDRLANLAVTAAKLAVDSVYTNAIQDDACTSVKIPNNAILARHIGPLEIKTAALDDLSVTSGKVNFAADTIDAAFLQSNSVTTVQIAPAAITSVELGLNSVGTNAIVNSSITTDKYADASISTDKLQSAIIDADKLASNCVGTDALIDGNTTTAKLADLACTTEKIALEAITDAQVDSGGIGRIADNAISNANLQASSVDTANIVDAAIVDSKVAVGLNGSKLLNNSLSTDKYADGSVGGNALANNSISDVHIQTAAVTDAKILDCNGSKLIDGTVTGLKFDINSFSGGLKVEGGIVVHTNEIDPGSRNGITYDAQGHITAAVELLPGELPLATTTTVGAVSIPTDGGLVIDAAGSLSIEAAIAPGSVSGITYDLHGNITATRPLEGGDLPVSTSTTLGGVIVPTTNSNPIVVDANGNITLTTQPLLPGRYASVDINQYGLAVGGSAILAVDQIPDLNAGKITSGQFTNEFIGDDAIDSPQITDYATCLMQEDFPGTGDFLGQFWYTPSTAQLRVYSRGSGPANVWTSVGFGNLQQQNLRVGFTYNATTATVINLTPEGIQAGLVAGSPIPEPTDELSGMYGVCVEGGNAITVKSLTGEVHTPGDWILCLSAAEGWVQVDVTSGSGGGGGATVLNDLLDVTISGLSNEQVLQYNSTQLQWVNVDLPPTIDKLNDLSDVNAVPTAAGDFLTWNGTDNWVSTNVIDCGTF